MAPPSAFFPLLETSQTPQFLSLPAQPHGRREPALPLTVEAAENR
jgi:hypothetical protein